MKVSRRELVKLAMPSIILPSRLLAEPVGFFAANQAVFNRPYTAQSVWNAKPVGPVLEGHINPTTNSPSVSGGVPAYFAKASDPPVTIPHLYIEDELGHRDVTIPHFPAHVVPANTTDHDAIIFDSTTNLFHSFWRLSGEGTSWTASAYAVDSAVANNPYWGGGASQGLGVGTPARVYSGIRAAGCNPLAGALRNWELDALLHTGTYPKHALVFSLSNAAIAKNSASSGPPPKYPATMQDPGFRYTGAKVGAASWPLGQFFMLPADFNVGGLSEPGTIAIAKTLMEYGAYLMDSAGVGPWSAFYCEPPASPSYFVKTKGNGRMLIELSGYYTNYWGGYSYEYMLNGLWHNNGELKEIIASLQAVASVSGWLDGNGNPFKPTPWADMNVLRMSGPYVTVSGTRLGLYDTARNLYVVPPGSAAFVIYNIRYQPAKLSSQGPWLNWSDTGGWYMDSAPTEGRSYTLSCYGSGKLTARLLVQDHGLSTTYYASGTLMPGESTTFNWPNESATATLMQISNPANGGGGIRLELVGN